MKRFDEDFISLNGEKFRQIISDTYYDGVWPQRYSKTIIPYSILDSKAYNGSKRGRRVYGLTDLEPVPHFDLIIVDEAHHIRNGSMEKEKSFAYKCVKYFCDNADAVVMLTATPLQTSNDDLFTLLNLLRPDVVIDKLTFEMMSRPNAAISAAARAVRHAEDNWRSEALSSLLSVNETQWGEKVIVENPVYTKAIETLKKDVITREEKVSLISDIESLNSFSTMINRTRRKDIQDFCIRRSFTLSVNFTSEQEALHNELLNFESTMLSVLHGDAKSILFMMTTIRRQAASCIFGIAPHIREIVKKRFYQLDEDFDDEYNEKLVLSDDDVSKFKSMATKLLRMADNLPDEDPKFSEILKVIEAKQAQDNNKIMIFSTFRYTLNYLYGKLNEFGYRVAQVNGSVKDEDRLAIRQRFALSKEDDKALDILLFTEVGSEGLDYQFCDMMINYDLPWNPMKIEQRIGRIDRRGQKSEAVNIYNVITEDTVDADIYYRCLKRIGIFENNIGECDEILGDIETQIMNIVTDSKLTEEERRVKLEQMADNEVNRHQELERLEEEKKELFGVDTSEFDTATDVKNAESIWLTQDSLYLLTCSYLNDRLGKGKYIVGEGGLKQLHLTFDARTKIKEDYFALNEKRDSVSQPWLMYLKGTSLTHSITFDSDTAKDNRAAFYITALHPFVKQAAKYYSQHSDLFVCIRYSTENYKAGRYYFSIYAWEYTGNSKKSCFVVVCEDDILAKEITEIIQEAESCDKSEVVDEERWGILNDKHIGIWEEAKQAYVNEERSVSVYKKESLSNNYANRVRSLEQIISQLIREKKDEKIIKMRKSELEKVKREYNVNIQKIDDELARADIHTELFVNGIIDITK